MTHPADHVYRFDRLEHWGEGFAQGLVFSPEGTLATPSSQAARQIAAASPGEEIRLLAADPCGRLLWLERSGCVRALDGGLPVRIAVIERGLAERAQRLVWGQEIAWIVAGGDVVRLDAKSGDRMGTFAAPGWQVLDAVGDRCDGAIVAEAADGRGARLRQIRPEGQTRVLHVIEDATEVVALARFGERGAVHLVDRTAEGWRTDIVDAERGKEVLAYPKDPARTPGRMVTMDGPGRLIFATPPHILFPAAFGLLGPAQPIARAPGMGAIVDLLWMNGVLHAATARGLYAIEPADQAAPALQAQYITPALRSPPGPRSGWLRADLAAALPSGAQVTIRSRGFDDAAGFMQALRDDPQGGLVQQSWRERGKSVHAGSGTDAPLRHYLGEEKAEYLALRFDISLPACSPSLALERLDVLYPERSLIESLPAIYRTGDASDAQLRRMLSPFQALADEIDDLIGDGIRRLDPDETDDIWAGFLLSWLGFSAFARLPAARRRAFLKAMPRALEQRGTLQGLARVMDVLAPEGYAIEDAGLGPDIWVLPERHDTAGARLGRETLAGAGAPQGLRLGCDPLGDVPIGRRCVDPAIMARRCSGDVTVRVFGGAAAREALSPFVDRIVRAFMPAHTRVRFTFDAHRPPEALERGRPAGPATDAETLITLDPGQSRALGAWRLPAAGTRIVPKNSATLDSAVLDGTLVLA